MPPFSGKKKKEQLKEKRQRKRDDEELQRQEESERERRIAGIIAAGGELTDEAIRGAGDSPLKKPKGRKANKQRQEAGQIHERDDAGAVAGGAYKGGGNDVAGAAKDEFMYGADRKGVRSVFKKETTEEVEARRRVNYQPLERRQMMANSGIPFGSWFWMPGTGDATATATSDDSAKKIAESDGAAFSLIGEGGASRGFPVSIELPSRGWRLSEDDGNVVALSNCTVGAEDGGESADDGARDAKRRSRSSSSGSDEDDEGGDSRRGKGGEVAATEDSSALHTATEVRIDEIEREHFAMYLRYMETFPPASSPLHGLQINSYERNLDVWRQLWRTVEVSDVVVIVADARYPVIHIPLSLLHYIVKEEQKPCVVVFNKSDLLPQFVLTCWLRFITYYLRNLGFNVRGDHADEILEAAEDVEIAEGVATNGGVASERKRRYLRDGHGEGARIVLQTFTADPESEHAQQHGKADSGEVDVAARRRKKKQRRAKMYEQLRAGTLHIAKGDMDDEESDDSDSGYASNENFKGMAQAEKNLRQEKDEHKELAHVAKAITSLLTLCKSLAPAGKGAPWAGAEPPVKVTVPGEGDKAAAEEKRVDSRQAVKPNKQPRKPRRRAGGSRRKKGATAEYSNSDNEISATSDSEDSSCSEIADEREEDSEAYVHIGFVGFPNVGKSSLLNCIRGTKVVSVSATPGHTKHLQTIPVPSEGVTLVDSPGLAFPLLGLPRPLQAVIGTHQIAQTRDPQSGVAYLASHLTIEKLYGLKKPDGADAKEEWSPYDLCEAYAQKRGYFVKHGKGALDLHRAAIALLQEAYEGRLVLYYGAPEMNLLGSKQYETMKGNLLVPVFCEGGKL